MNKRVVVTGLGVVSSIGIGKDAFWDALVKGKSGISKIDSFDTSVFPTHSGGEVKDFQVEKKTFGRASALAVSAARMALCDAGLELEKLGPERFGLAIGTTMGESQILEEINHAWIKDGHEAIDARLIPLYPANVLGVNVAGEFKLKGENFVIPCACAAGNYCIGYAFDLIRYGRADKMLAIGADAFARLAFIGFNRLYAIAPEKCQPFDKNRKGMMVGEGAGALLLEPLEAALARKAGIYAEVLGYGLSCDARHMTAPLARGIAKAIEKSLKQSNIQPQDVDYISAHGTGTPANDSEECAAIKKVFPRNYKSIAISSIKSMLGHTMGAASSIEAISCCLSVKNDIIPPTINYETPDEDCDIDCVPNFGRRQKVEVALNNASAFGGNNACVVFKKYGAS
ncbi:MAG: beta-ketoacyl-[acyl-carrier-protein] synthase family protein [Candidatus Omnitrophota bacterium]